MELDTKQKVLLAVYIEYQKDVPEFYNVLTSDNLGISDHAISVSLRKLQSEELIREFETRTADGRIGSSMNRIMMTRDGIKYVEDKMLIGPKDSGEEKIETIIERTANWSWEQIKDIASKTLAEMIKP